MKKNVFFVGLILLLSAQSGLFAAPKVTVRLASLVPENTAWGASLNRLAKEWKAATNGEVDVIIYHGGIISSNETELIQKLRQNQIQAAVLTSAGLSSISENVWALSCPFLIQNDDELDYVLDNVKAELESSIESKNYKLLAWSKAGWIKFFGRDPIFEPKDLKKQKIASGEETINEVFKKLGYTVVIAGFNDTLSALSSKKADAVFSNPVYVASMQLFGITKNMCSISVAPIMGGIIINDTTWKRIPDKYKPKLMDVCKDIEKESNSAIIELEKSAMDVMLKNGLVVDEVNPAQEALWRNETIQASSLLTGGSKPIIDRALFMRIEALLKAKRSQ